MPVLAALDLQGIQRFVFSSNRLRDVVGASFLVERAATDQPDGLIWQELANAGVSDPGEAIVMAGGGNAVLRFDELGRACEFAGRYSRRLLQDAPGLEVAIEHRPYQEGELARALATVRIDLSLGKLEHRPSVPLLGLGVTERCTVTGWPATGIDSQGGSRTPSSSLVQQIRSRELRDGVKGRWKDFLPQSEHDLAFPLELDDLGRTPGIRSLIGIVHLDGNQVGGAISGWLAGRVGVQDEEVRMACREWSTALRRRVETTLAGILQRLEAALAGPDGSGALSVVGNVAELGFALSRDPGGARRHFLPIRPILLGGDDLTFVCDGRIALDLAAAGVEHFAGDIPHLGTTTACAGVALVRSHTPFIRAYQLAEDLCRSAKQAMVKSDSSVWSRGGLDWHLGAVRPGDEIDDVREAGYRRGDYALTCRPYPLGPASGDSTEGTAPTWGWLAREVLGTTSAWSLRGPVWRDRQSKVRALREMIAEGPDAVERALQIWQVTSPAPQGLRLPAAIKDGFVGTRTPLLDAVELLDRLITLDVAGDGHDIAANPGHRGMGAA
jgi:hypothetical protein